MEPDTVDWDVELRRLLDDGERDRRARTEQRLLVLMGGAIIAGIFLMAALVALVAGGGA